MRILFIVKNYPQLSQTYIKSEINALINDFDIHIISTSLPNSLDPEHLEFKHIPEEEAIIKAIRKIKPDVIHSHYLLLAPLVSSISKKTGIPFTIRAHSFDSLENGKTGQVPKHIPELHKHLNHDLCKGVLIFPFTRNLLVSKGNIWNDKLIDSCPVVDVNRFYNREANGDAIMNIGACIPKKAMGDFVKLSKLIQNREFNLYALGHNKNSLKKLSIESGGRVHFKEPVPYSRMPLEYKKHSQMVYTADFQMKTVGWPIAAVEAMASGTIVYMPRIRPDMSNYIGEAGYLYDDLEEITEMLDKPIDPKIRSLAFEYAQEFDISKKIDILVNAWERPIPSIYSKFKQRIKRLKILQRTL